MDNIKNDEYYCKKAIENIDIIKKYLCNKSFDEFIKDETLIDAIMFRLIQLVENIKCISLDFKTKHKEIPWGNIIGFRNGIVHEYGKTNYNIVYEIVTDDLDSLKIALEDK